MTISLRKIIEPIVQVQVGDDDDDDDDDDDYDADADYDDDNADADDDDVLSFPSLIAASHSLRINVASDGGLEPSARRL